VIRLPGSRLAAGLLYGGSRAGAAVVPISVHLQPYQLRHVLSDVEPVLVMTRDSDVALLQSLTNAPVTGVERAWRSIAALPVPVAVEYPVLSGEDTALLMLTSGSTAMPKAVVCPHARVVFAARAIATQLRYRPDDVIVSSLSMAFDYGLYQLFLAAIGRAEVVLVDGEPSAALLARIQQFAGTVVPIVPSLAPALIAAAARDRRPTRMRLFTSTGETLQVRTIVELRERFPGAAVAPMFGTTECKRISILPPDEEVAHRGTVGEALPGTVVRIVDAAGRRVPTGEIGEIAVRGGHVMAGYWRAPALTARRFRPSPETGEIELLTGDFGRIDADGFLRFEGRRDDLFKRRGMRTSIGEIEAAALDVPGVQRAVAVLVGPGERLVVCVVGNQEPLEVLRELAARLPAAKVPDECRVLAAIPVIANGKTDRAQLASQVLETAS
jgi:acyl-CoA synthetase (AMP-forming)/AMP-acid ligase II